MNVYFQMHEGGPKSAKEVGAIFCDLGLTQPSKEDALAELSEQEDQYQRFVTEHNEAQLGGCQGDQGVRLRNFGSTDHPLS